MAEIAITPADVELGAGKHKIFRGAIAQDDIEAGEFVRFNSATSKFLLAAATGDDESKVRGMALATAFGDQPFDIVEEGEVIINAGTVAVSYVLAPTGGKMVPVDDALLVSTSRITSLGVGKTGGRFQLKINASLAVVP